MKIKINEQIICIPPFVSAKWEQISLMQSEENPETKTCTLILHLLNGNIIKIPNLDPAIIEISFSGHQKYLDQLNKALPLSKDPSKSFFSFLQQTALTLFDDPKLKDAKTGLLFPLPSDSFEIILQHNSSHKDHPDAPTDLLEKIVGMMKLITKGDLKLFPYPEPHCNCLHCQVGRLLHNGTQEEASETDSIQEPVTENDLKFRTWDISQHGEKLYIVSNPLDPKEQYNVYLGNPVGCTCGKPHCEHIKAVLYS